MDTVTLKRDLATARKVAKHETDRFTPLVIFSSDRDFPAFAADHDIGYKSVMGLYQGLIEESYVIKHTDGSLIMGWGLLVGQENVLLLSPQEAVYGGNREVWLAKVDKDGMFLLPDPPEFLGLWYKVSTHEALHSDAWTCYPEDNAWYVAKMPERDL